MKLANHNVCSMYMSMECDRNLAGTDRDCSCYMFERLFADLQYHVLISGRNI